MTPKNEPLLCRAIEAVRSGNREYLAALGCQETQDLLSEMDREIAEIKQAQSEIMSRVLGEAR